MTGSTVGPIVSETTQQQCIQLHVYVSIKMRLCYTLPESWLRGQAPSHARTFPFYSKALMK